MSKDRLIIRYWYRTTDGKLWTTFIKPPEGIPRGVCLSDTQHIDSRDLPSWDSLPEDIRSGDYYC